MTDHTLRISVYRGLPHIPRVNLKREIQHRPRLVSSQNINLTFKISISHESVQITRSLNLQKYIHKRMPHRETVVKGLAEKDEDNSTFANMVMVFRVI